MAEPRPSQTEEEFYESMPATMDRYAYRDSAAEEIHEADKPTTDEVKLTAVVTILLTVLVAIGLSLVLLRGLDALRSITPTDQQQQ